jgi:HEAT repeat protein
LAEAVEELGHKRASKFLEILSRGRCANYNPVRAPRSGLGDVSGVARYPLISTLIATAQIATEIRHLTVEEFFNSLGDESPSARGRAFDRLGAHDGH